MKRSTLIFLFCISFTLLLGKIRNGYEMDASMLTNSINQLRTMLENESITRAERNKVKGRLQILVDYATYCQLTYELLEQFYQLSPDVYSELNTIRDKRGRVVDVYVKFVPKCQAIVPLSAATFFGRSSTDEDAHTSEYGENSIAIEICCDANSLLLLYHELGHAKYIVPNLASYAQDYFQNFGYDPVDLSQCGHKRGDPSGLVAKNFEKKYLRDLSVYKKIHHTRQESVLTILQRIWKTNRANQHNNSGQIVARQL